MRITPQDRVKPLKQPLGSRDDFLALLYALGQGVPLLADLYQKCVRVFGFFRFHFPKVAREGTNVGALCNTRFSNPGHSRSQIRPLKLKPGQHPGFGAVLINAQKFWRRKGVLKLRVKLP